MIIAIDFDGTIVEDAYPAIGQLRPMAKEMIQRLKEDGHYLIINTCRCGDRLTEAVNFLLERRVPLDRVNSNNPKSVALYGSSSRKIYADIYIDDRQVGGLPPWRDMYEWISNKNNTNNNSHEK